MTREEVCKTMTLQEALQVLKETNCYGTMDIAKSVIINSLEQEPKTGHWIMHDKHRECSRCKVWLLKDMPRCSYCPNCGCKMESEVK